MLLVVANGLVSYGAYLGGKMVYDFGIGTALGHNRAWMVHEHGGHPHEAGEEHEHEGHQH